MSLLNGKHLFFEIYSAFSQLYALQTFAHEEAGSIIDEVKSGVRT